MQRVLVLGCCGAGKSTVSRRLAAVTGLPLIQLDLLYWRPGWTPTPAEEMDALVTRLCAGPRWIIDGNYQRSLPLRLPRADTVIWLDYPRRVCMARVLWRMARDYHRVREG